MVSGESLILNPGFYLLTNCGMKKKIQFLNTKKQSNMRFDGGGGDNVGDK